MESPAISKSQGPCIILAGAGTGKTHSIVEKVKYLIKNNLYKPKEILCLTFSNEAANSMASRLLADLQDNGNYEVPKVSTFHALCSDLLKEHGSLIGVNPEFRIMIPEDAMVSLHKNLRVNARLCSKYVSSMSTAKDLGITLEEYSKFIEQEKLNIPENVEQELEKLQFELKTLHIKSKQRGSKSILEEKVDILYNFLKRQKFFNAWRAYEKLKAKKEALDYSDLNVYALKLLTNYPKAAKWKYIVVDEFQDTNKIQLELIDKLASHKNITVVGDLNQSIYRFRGAYKDNISLFKSKFKVKDSDIYALDKSRRSPNRVLKVAHKIVQRNYQDPLECFEVVNYENRQGSQVQVIELKNGKEEVRKLLEIIKSELETRKPEDICVIFRTHQQTNMLKRALEAEKIQFQSATKKPLLKQPNIKHIISHLEIINDIKQSKKPNTYAWWDVIHQSKLSKGDEIKIGEFIRKNREKEDLQSKLLEIEKHIDIEQESKLKYQALIKRIHNILEHTSKPVPDIVNEACSILVDSELEKTKEGRETLLAIGELKNKVKEQNNYEFYDLSSLLNHITVMKALDVDLDSPVLEQKGIVIMTAHATKGLEYPIVIMSNLAQKKFPIERTNIKSLIPPELMPQIKKEITSLPQDLRQEALNEIEYENQIKEERRLCYVAITRTKEKLYITYAQEYNGKKHEPSQFLAEADYLKNSNIKFTRDLEEKYVEPILSMAPQEIQTKQDPEKTVIFSPSNLRTFMECQKHYEYKYVFGMPDPEPPAWDAMKLGSFVHQIIDKGIKSNSETEREFLQLATQESLKPEWENLDIKDALLLLKIFFERNKSKYNQESRTEEKLFTTIEGLRFYGIADRIDFTPQGLEIIDYKTGQSFIPPRERNWQLGYYAIACSKFGHVHKVTLDMLRHDKPLEFEIDDRGDATEKISKRMSFNIDQVKQELIETAREIIKAYKEGFKPCPIEKNCEFCNEYVYNTG